MLFSFRLTEILPYIFLNTSIGVLIFLYGVLIFLLGILSSLISILRTTYCILTFFSCVLSIWIVFLISLTCVLIFSDCNMLSLNLQPIFKARGIDKPFSYLTSAGFPSYTAHNLLNAKTVTFRLSHIDKLCSLLNCTPNDLLVWTPNRNEKLADTHPITRLKKQNTDLNWQDTIKTIPLDQLSEIVKIINGHKNSK